MYFVMVDSTQHDCGIDEASEKAEASLRISKTFQRPALPLNKFLLGASSEYLQQELQRRTASATGDRSKGIWPQTHQDYLKSKGLTYKHITVPPAVKTSPWFELLPSRERECLGLALHVAAATNVNLTTVDWAFVHR